MREAECFTVWFSAITGEKGELQRLPKICPKTVIKNTTLFFRKYVYTMVGLARRFTWHRAVRPSVISLSLYRSLPTKLILLIEGVFRIKDIAQHQLSNQLHIFL